MRDLGELDSHWRINILPQDSVASVMSVAVALLLLRERDKRPRQRTVKLSSCLGLRSS